MARKYKRDSSGRFAGGGGGGSTASRGATAKPKKAVTSQRKVTKKSGGVKASVRSTAKWIKKNPKKSLAIAYGLSVAHGNIANRKQLNQLHSSLKSADALKKAQQFARKVASDKKGIGSNKPGQGLKMSKKRAGAYKIRS